MPRQEEFGFLKNIPQVVPEGTDTRSPLQKRRDRQLLKKSLRPAREWQAGEASRTEQKPENIKKDYRATVDFEGRSFEFRFSAPDREEAMARARWHLMSEFLGSQMELVERILALDESQISINELSEAATGKDEEAGN